MSAEHTALDDRREGRGYDDTGQHRLVEVPDHLLDRESDGSDRSIEGSGDTGRSPYRQQAFHVLGRNTGELAYAARDPGADLYSGPSRPKDEPVPIGSAEMKNLPMESRSLSAPDLPAYATFTCGMPLPRAFGTHVLKQYPGHKPTQRGDNQRPRDHVRLGAASAGSTR